jgi:hypothetical protein
MYFAGMPFWHMTEMAFSMLLMQGFFDLTVMLIPEKSMLGWWNFRILQSSTPVLISSGRIWMLIADVQMSSELIHRTRSSF